MTPKERLIESFRALCSKTAGGVDTVAAATGLSAESLRQVIAGTRLPSGEPRGIGPRAQRAISAQFPGWDVLSHHAKEPPPRYAVDPGALAWPGLSAEGIERLLRDLRAIPSRRLGQLLEQIHQEAELAREAHEHLAKHPEPAPPAPSIPDDPVSPSRPTRPG